jgi:hypothetical protein
MRLSKILRSLIIAAVCVRSAGAQEPWPCPYSFGGNFGFTYWYPGYGNLRMNFIGPHFMEISSTPFGNFGIYVATSIEVRGPGAGTWSASGPWEAGCFLYGNLILATALDFLGTPRYHPSDTRNEEDSTDGSELDWWPWDQDPDNGGGASGIGTGGTTLNCTKAYITIEIDYGDGTGWHTWWEGWANVCQ